MMRPSGSLLTTRTLPSRSLRGLSMGVHQRNKPFHFSVAHKGFSASRNTLKATPRSARMSISPVSAPLVTVANGGATTALDCRSAGWFLSPGRQGSRKPRIWAQHAAGWRRHPLRARHWRGRARGTLFAHCSRQGPALRRRSPRLAVNPSADEPIGRQAPRPVQPAARSRLLACQTLSFSAAPLFAGSIASSWPASLAVSSMT